MMNLEIKNYNSQHDLKQDLVKFRHRGSSQTRNKSAALTHRRHREPVQCSGDVSAIYSQLEEVAVVNHIRPRARYARVYQLVDKSWAGGGVCDILPSRGNNYPVNNPNSSS